MISAKLTDIPEEGLQFAGETTTDIFAFAETETEVRPRGPVSYDLHLSRVGPELMLAQGQLVARFYLRCVVCLEEFPYTLTLDGYAADLDLPEDGVLDLTERVREDLLLELPPYPHCDRDGDDPGRKCPRADQLADPEKSQGGEDAGPSAWDALDGLDSGDS